MIYVTLFQHSNYGGERMDIPAGGQTAQPIDPQFGVSSLQIPPGFTVELSDSRSGISFSYTESAAYVGDDINDRADIVTVTQICAPDAQVC